LHDLKIIHPIFPLIELNRLLTITILTALLISNLVIGDAQIVFDNNSPLYYSKKDSVKYQTKTLFSGNFLVSAGNIEYWNNEKMSMIIGTKKTLTVLANFNLKKNYYFFWMVYFQFDREIYKNVNWLPDYSFMFCRDKYMPNNFMWGYSNFGINKFNNSSKEIWESLSSGTFYFGYRVPLPRMLGKIVKIHTSSNFNLSIQINYAIKYYNVNSKFTGGIFDGKPSLGLNVQYSIYKGLFVSFATNYNIKEDTQSPWASDYSYSFGYVNGKPWKISILYSNSLNKYPWSKNKLKSGLLFGDFGIALNYSLKYKKPYNK
jgi:hypothetical protein